MSDMGTVPHSVVHLIVTWLPSVTLIPDLGGRRNVLSPRTSAITKERKNRVKAASIVSESFIV